MQQMVLWLHAWHPPGLERDSLGYVASALVLATFCMRSMRPLRATAILSNVGFIAYALADHILPVLVLHCILLPVNIFRFVEITLSRHTVRRLPRQLAPAEAD
ncbi:MAG TPA: hypothetical protein VMB34_16035 [Acetobacteraceae bacterium]|nr:hypothetical protein [Acetobacteraceae bacterium]